MKTPRAYSFGRKLDGEKATEEDWDKWREEFWEKEAKRLLAVDTNEDLYNNSTDNLDI